MYQTTCTCGGQLFLMEVHAVFAPREVPIDPQVGTNFGMDDIADTVVETAVCGRCNATYALADLYQEGAADIINWIMPAADYLH
jgi:hypothetical protein